MQHYHVLSAYYIHIALTCWTIKKYEIFNIYLWKTHFFVKSVFYTFFLNFLYIWLISWCCTSILSVTHTFHSQWELYWHFNFSYIDLHLAAYLISICERKKNPTFYIYHIVGEVVYIAAKCLFPYLTPLWDLAV